MNKSWKSPINVSDFHLLGHLIVIKIRDLLPLSRDM